MIWALIPAAGSGRRMAGAGEVTIPKQYLPLAGRTVLEHSLSVFLDHPRIRGAVIVLAEGDRHWTTLEIASHPRIGIAAGGAERADSVLSGLNRLLETANRQDWVLVHDAARPCLQRADVDRLLQAVESEGDDGGLLAIPMRDTVKRARGSQVDTTVDRSGLWLAQTPQMFRLGVLHDVLAAALKAGEQVTDESSAMERAGYRPKLVSGSAANVKITCPEDLAVADGILRTRGTAC